MKLKTLLTFDYELYFGENYYSEDIVLFNPTDKLLEVLKKNNTKAIFFIDICSIYAYKKYKKYDYIEKFINQMVKIKKYGHEIEMHFHPHWINSKYDNSKQEWIFDHKNYSYSNLIDNLGEKKANYFFLEVHSLFIDIIGYPPTAFRAGGYTIQPYEKDLISLLKKLNYKIDSSVTPYKKYISKAQFFDFLDCEELNIWFISNNSFLKQGKIDFLEMPISSVKKSFINLIPYALLKLINKTIPNKIFNRRGIGASLELIEYKNDALTIAFDMSSQKDKKIIKYITSLYINKFKRNNTIYLNILSHPKAIFDESLDVMEWYINYMKENYDCEFIGFDELEI